jgi:hypothetical protein
MVESGYQFDQRLLLGSLLVAGIGTLAVLLSLQSAILSFFFWVSRRTLVLLGVDCTGFGCFAVVLTLSTIYLSVSVVLVAAGIVQAKQRFLN